MKYILAASAVLFAIPAFAHTGHVEMVAGHTHTLAELAIMSAGPAALAIVLVTLVLQRVKRRND